MSDDGRKSNSGTKIKKEPPINIKKAKCDLKVPDVTLLRKITENGWNQSFAKDILERIEDLDEITFKFTHYSECNTRSRDTEVRLDELSEGRRELIKDFLYAYVNITKDEMEKMTKEAREQLGHKRKR